ncbi:hypothetical protein D3C79_759330 [compost metagenome]
MIRPGRAGGCHRHAGAQQGEVALGHRQIEPQPGKLIEMEQGVTTVDQSPFTQVDEADGAVKRRLQGTQGELVTCCIHPCLNLRHCGLLPFQL